jgi:uncharacterized OB-fold protein
VAERRPNRTLGRGHDQFWAFAAEDELRLQRCLRCRHLNWPAVADRCERCDHEALDWERLSGRGTVISWCTFHKRYYPDADVPYDVIAVQLDEGAVFIANPHGFSPSQVHRNARVMVSFCDAQDDAGPFRLPMFALSDPSGGSAGRPTEFAAPVQSEVTETSSSKSASMERGHQCR